VQLLLPLLLVTGLWIALHRCWRTSNLRAVCGSNAHLVEQGLLIGIALFFSLQYLLPVFLLLHLVASYIYLGPSPLWNLLVPPPAICCASSLAAAANGPVRFCAARWRSPDLGLLHWLPTLILGELAKHKVNLCRSSPRRRQPQPGATFGSFAETVVMVPRSL